MNANNPMTPGVYTREVNAFPNSVPMVPTAVPVFIGYTTKTSSPKGEDLTKKPRFISSFREFTDLFGGQPPIQFELEKTASNGSAAATQRKADGSKPGSSDSGSTPGAESSSSRPSIEVVLSGTKYSVRLNKRFYLYDALRMYFANGGGPCYVVSVDATIKANSSSTPTASENPQPVWGDVKKAVLWDDQQVMDTVLKEIPFPKPTIICIPDARMCNDSERLALYNSVLAHCTGLADRIVLMDVPTTKRKPKEDAETFRNTVSGDKPSYGVAYYPELLTNLYDQDSLDASRVNTSSNNDTSDLTLLQAANWKTLQALANALSLTALEERTVKAALDSTRLTTDKSDAAASEGTGKTPDAGQSDDQKGASASSDPRQRRLSDVKENSRISAALLQWRAELHASLLQDSTVSSDYKALLSAMASLANVMPPSAAMAGIYARVDSDVGVWRAPANINILGVVAPTVTVTDDTQAGLNVDANAGKSINAIRSFYGRGPAIVWGARTLDGNSKDWRYINVRRTVILIEQSVANAAFSMVFEPNTAPTWTTCRAMIAGFLRSLWAAGALQGATPEDAFSVTVGLGTTMTADDILDGIMRIEVKLALVRPAEFIVITYQQQMAKS